MCAARARGCDAGFGEVSSGPSHQSRGARSVRVRAVFCRSESLNSLCSVGFTHRCRRDFSGVRLTAFFRALARVSVTRLEARSGPWTPTSTGPGACLPDRPTNDQSVTTLFARSDHLLGDLFSRKPSRPLRWRPCGRFDALSVLGAAAHRPGGARTRDRHRARTRGGDEHTPRGDAGGAVPGQGGAGLAHDWSVLAPLPSALLGRQGVDRDEKPRPDTQHPARPDALGGAVARPVRRARSRFLHRPPASRRRLRRAQACVVVEQPPVEPRHRLESDPAAARHCAE